ncbi:hypothetical protein [Streptomyces sp. NPDC055109]
MAAGDVGLYGAIAAIAGSAAGVVTTLINRERSPTPGAAEATGAPPGTADEVALDPDMATVADIAKVVARYGRKFQQQDQRIRTLENAGRHQEARIQAMGRYMHVLKVTIRDLGGSVPEPAPLDAHLID